MANEEVVHYQSYEGIPTFWRSEQTRNLDNADIVVMGIPFDVSVSNRPGARFGARAIREQSLHQGTVGIGNHPYPWGYDVRDKFKMIDYGDVTFKVNENSIPNMIEQAEIHASKILQAGCKLLTLGGDHTIPYGLVRAAKKHFGEIAMVHFDSHTDTCDSNETGIFHGTFAADLANEGSVNPKKSIQVFIRSIMPESDYNILWANDAMSMSPKEIAQYIKAIVGDTPVYFTYDIDSLDPAYAPGTGTPCSGGPTVAFVREVLYNLRGINVVAADLVEVLPAYDTNEVTSLAASTIAGDLIYLMAETVEAKESKQLSQSTVK